MTNEWRVLDFDFPEELPFYILSERLGEEAAVYITHVGDHSEEKEKAFGYLEGVVMKMPVNQHTIDSLKSFHERVRGKGVYTLYKVVQPVPKSPQRYRILLPLVCNGTERDQRLCEYSDNGYCMKRRRCPSQKKHPEISTL